MDNSNQGAANSENSGTSSNLLPDEVFHDATQQPLQNDAAEGQEVAPSPNDASNASTVNNSESASGPTTQAPPTKFYAVRSSDSLKGVAILTTLEDAQKLGGDCKECSSLEEAAVYLGMMLQPKKQTAVSKPKVRRKRPLPSRIKQSEFDKTMAVLQQFKSEHHHVNVPGPFSKTVPLEDKYIPLSKTMAMLKQAVKQWGSDECPLTEQQMQQLVEMGVVPGNVLELQGNSNKRPRRGSLKDDSGKRWQTPTSAHNLLKLKTEMEESWDDRIALLKEYKEEKGHANVPRRPNKSLGDKYLPLCKFAGRITQFLEDYYKEKKHFFLTPERVQLLEEIGFTTTSPTRKVNARQELLTEVSFDDMIAALKQVRETNAPIKTNRQLEWWIAEQRKEYALFKSKQPSSLTPERVAIMAEAGFPFEKMKSPTWDERAVEWLEFKTRTGRDPMREESSLYQWVYKQRVKYKQKTKEGKKNNLTEEQIKRLTDWGFNWEMKFQFPNMAKPASWEERYQELMKFKEEHGNCQVHKNVPVLGQWVKQQRKDYRFFVQGSKPTRMTQDRIAKLSAIGFDFGEKRWNTGKMKTAHAAIEKGKQQDQQQVQQQQQVHHQQQQQVPHILQGVPRLGGGDSENEDGGYNDPNGFQPYPQALPPWDGYRTFNNNM